MLSLNSPCYSPYLGLCRILKKPCQGDTKEYHHILKVVLTNYAPCFYWEIYVSKLSNFFPTYPFLAVANDRIKWKTNKIVINFEEND